MQGVFRCHGAAPSAEKSLWPGAMSRLPRVFGLRLAASRRVEGLWEERRVHLDHAPALGVGAAGGSCGTARLPDRSCEGRGGNTGAEQNSQWQFSGITTRCTEQNSQWQLSGISQRSTVHHFLAHFLDD